MTKKAAYFAMAVAYGVLYFLLIWHRYFNVDEMEHLHAVWCMAHGMTLYRDFFEHHGWLWYLFISPIPKLFPDPIAALYAGRVLMAFCWAGILGLYSRLVNPTWSSSQKALAFVLLCSFSTFSQHSIEIRPDVPAAFLVLCVLVLGSGAWTPARAGCIGLLTGVALFFSPKIIFPIGGFFIGQRVDRSRNENGSQIFFYPGWLLLGILVPVTMTCVLIFSSGAWESFITYFFRFNSHLHGPYPWTYGIHRSLHENPIFWLLMAIGIFSKKERWAYKLSLLSGLFGLFFVKPIPFGQYFLLFAPLMAYFATAGCLHLAEVVSWPGGLWSKCLIAIVAASIFTGLRYQVRELELGNQTFISNVQCLMKSTGPDDRILDIYSGLSLFRPHACFFWWLCPDIPMTLGERRVEKCILEALADPGCRGLIMDPYYYKHHPAVGLYAAKHFHPSQCGTLYLRNSK